MPGWFDLLVDTLGIAGIAVAQSPVVKTVLSSTMKLQVPSLVRLGKSVFSPTKQKLLP
jgi:hypothetical protein